MTNFNRGGRGVLGAEQIDTEHKVPHTNLRARAEQRLMARKRSKMNRARLHARLLSPVMDKLDAIDFMVFRPGKVIDDFWWKYRCKTNNFNLFDLILLAKSAIRQSNHKREDLNSFLDDFALFMIASYTKHYMDDNDGIVGWYLFTDQAEHVKTKVSQSFLRILIGLEEGRGHD